MTKHSRRRWLGLLATSIAVLVAAGPAHAGTLDQSQTGFAGTFAAQDEWAPGQTFTAGMTGSLDQVDLLVGRGGTTAPLFVEIHTVSAGIATGTVLASTSVPASSVPSNVGLAWLTVAFAAPAAVTAEQEYAIVLYAPGAPGGSHYNWGTALGGYARGSAFAGRYGSWFLQPIFDMAFKTYVASVSVDAIPPEVTLAGPAAANEGTIGSYTFDTTDPDSDTFTLDASSCGASGSIVAGSVVFGAATGDGGLGCSFADDSPTGTSSDTSTVGITVGDQGASGTDTLDVTVSNVPPAVTITSPSSGVLVPAGSTTVVGTFTDPGKLDTHTCTISGAAGVVAYTPAGSGSGTCTGAVPLGPGSNTIEIEVCDDDTGCDAESVTVPSLYAIYAHEQCSGGAGKGLSVNGANANVGGFVHSNGNLTIGGANFISGKLSLYRPQSGCSTSYDPANVSFGPPSPSAPVQVSPAGSWPLALSRSGFSCTQPVKDEYVFNTSGQTIPAGVYCATKTFRINASNITGNITVLAPEIVINGKNVRLTPHTKGVLLYNINLDGSASSKEIVVDADFAADTTAVLSGLIHNPGGGIKVNGKSVRMTRGFLQALWVEINLDGYRMDY